MLWVLFEMVFTWISICYDHNLYIKSCFLGLSAKVWKKKRRPHDKHRIFDYISILLRLYFDAIRIFDCTSMLVEFSTYFRWNFRMFFQWLSITFSINFDVFRRSIEISILFLSYFDDVRYVRIPLYFNYTSMLVVFST